MIKYLLVVSGILCSVIAQLLLKKASTLPTKEFMFFIYFVGAAISYVIAFLLYSSMLKYFQLNKISPITTIGAMILISIFSTLLFNESFTIKYVIGLLFGIVAIFLIAG